MINKSTASLLSTLLLPMAICGASPALAGGPTIPPSDPPICTIDPGVHSLCEIDLIYSTADCGDVSPQSQDGGINNVGFVTACGYSTQPIVPYIQCRTVGDRMNCEGYPTSSPELGYSWTVSGPLRVHPQTSDMPENDRLISLSCAVKEGVGSLGLTIVNPHSGIRWTTTVPVKCTVTTNHLSPGR